MRSTTPIGELRLEPVTTVEQAEDMRYMRNSVRFYMTRNTSWINSLQQMEWLKTVDHQTIRPFLAKYQGKTIGYGIIREIDGLPWVTGAIHIAYRGYGLGEQLFRRLTEMASDGRPVMLEVLNSNKKALNLYRKIGYEPISANNRVEVMRYG